MDKDWKDRNKIYKSRNLDWKTSKSRKEKNNIENVGQYFLVQVG